MALTRRFGRRRVTLILLILTSVLLLTLDSRDFGPIDGARSGVLGIFSPVGDLFATITRPVSNTWNGAFSYDDVQAENQRLKAELDDLKGRGLQEDLATRELERLKQSLDIPFVAGMPQEKASIVSGGITNFDDTVKIDKGSSSGVQKGMAVVSGQGLVGLIIDSSDSTATMQLITSRDTAVGVKVPEKRGLLVLNGRGDPHQMSGVVDKANEAEVGDVVVTSGVEGSPYPAGIPVGRVAAVSVDQLETDKTIDVDVQVTLSDVEFVTVVKRGA